MPQGNQKLQVNHGGGDPDNYRDGRHIPNCKRRDTTGQLLIYEVLFITSSDLTRGSNPELF